MKITAKIASLLAAVAAGQLLAAYLVWVGTGLWFPHTVDMGFAAVVCMFLSLAGSFMILVDA